MPPADILSSIDAFCVDAMGTCTDWRGTVPREIRARAPHLSDEDAHAFAEDTRIANGGDGPLSADVLHREILDALLASLRWSALGAQWDAQAREELVLVWHRLDAWPDASQGLRGMKAHKLLVTWRVTIPHPPPNANSERQARHADFPWDVVLSSELFGTYKPNEKVYRAAAHHLALPPAKIAMVAAHVFDLRAAARCGMRTVYVRRTPEAGDVKSKDDGGEFDVVVDDLDELAGLLEAK
ncbi:hypothetical protein HWV62_12827 [Athelia sp. TMB]|nr:hypothetical protein HWV62_12827 [Athelia sp. TMB]